jgi:hypothetical protein
MNKFKEIFKNTIYYIIVSVLLWCTISCFIQRFKCPKMTETEIFLNIPQSFVCNWQHCK